MQPCRVHITGASGSGTTTLGRALAQAWSVPCHDTDDFYWLPQEPEFSIKRPVAERLELMERMFLPRRAWVLSGSLMGWGDGLMHRFDLVVFLRMDSAERLKRLKKREQQRYGSEALQAGGLRHKKYQAFLKWAAGYDDPDFSGRNRIGHENWLAHLTCPVLQLDSAASTEDLVDTIVAAKIDDRQ
ncbi:MAG: AAA family ATPase [Pseudomonadota bacterium]